MEEILLKSPILNDQNYFKCNTYGCTMKKTACVLRQKIEAKMKSQTKNDPRGTSIGMGCKGCVQGKKIMKSMDHSAIQPARSWGYRGTK